jgi:hypothetical protein
VGVLATFGDGVPLVELLDEEPLGVDAADDAPVLQLSLQGALQEEEDSGMHELDAGQMVEHGELGMPRSMGFGIDLEGDHQTRPEQARGRGRTRSLSPRSTRRSSVANRTLPTTPNPPSSPTSVIPSSPTFKGVARGA